MWGVVCVLLLASVIAGETEIDPVKAEACVMLANDFVVKDDGVAKTINESAYPHHETMKHVSVDIVIYCYNHISPALALRVINSEVTFTHPEAKEVCKYRRALFAKKDGELTVSEEQLSSSKRILAAGQLNKRKQRKPTKKDL